MTRSVATSDYPNAVANEYARRPGDRDDLLADFEADPDEFLAEVAEDPVLLCNSLVMTLGPRRAESPNAGSP